jgi:chromosome segregation protein
LYLKKLEIKGFKSFAENTELLLEPGINVIVGPNGCGKSNIADAIRWVLGESNVRHLRGQKNEDIIFNGTDKQKAQSMAMVDMTIDNACGDLPVDYREVTIGRRLFRNGESEYWLNKSRVRMKDIVGLFTGTGLGKRGYSLIGQGELEQVLNGQPFDRRLILEEASGTIKYRQQRDEVTQRLAASALDLQRVTDIMVEMEIHAAELSKKAARAQQYMTLQEEFVKLDRALIAAEITDSHKNLSVRIEDLQQKKASG